MDNEMFEIKKMCLDLRRIRNRIADKLPATARNASAYASITTALQYLGDPVEYAARTGQGGAASFPAPTLAAHASNGALPWSGGRH